MRVIMVKNRFAPMILSGRKTQTIRKTARFVPGDLLSLRRWAGAAYRTPQLKISDGWCTSVAGIDVSEKGLSIDFNPLGIDAATAFAWQDGFDSLDEFISFFEVNYSLPFTGYVIRFQLFENDGHAADGVPCANERCMFFGRLFEQNCARSVTYDLEEPFAPVCPKYIADEAGKAGKEQK